MATPSPYALATTEKASSGVSPVRNKQPGILSSPSISSSSSQFSTGYGNGYARDGDVVTESSDSLETPVTGTASSWYGQAARTPTAATFLPPEHNTAPNSEGFISLMDSQSFTFESSSRQSPSGTDSFEDEDLGLGNSKPKQKAREVEGDEGTPVEENTPATARPAEKAVGKHYSVRHSKRDLLLLQKQCLQLAVEGHGLADGSGAAKVLDLSRLISVKRALSTMTRTSNDGWTRRCSYLLLFFSL